VKGRISATFNRSGGLNIADPTGNQTLPLMATPIYACLVRPYR
jgi:hypothetical protein